MNYPCETCILVKSCHKVCSQLENNNWKLIRHIYNNGTCPDCNNNLFKHVYSFSWDSINIVCKNCNHVFRGHFNLGKLTFYRQIILPSTLHGVGVNISTYMNLKEISISNDIKTIISNMVKYEINSLKIKQQQKLDIIHKNEKYLKNIKNRRLSQLHKNNLKQKWENNIIKHQNYITNRQYSIDKLENFLLPSSSKKN